jgi:hypothetical protein
MIFLRGVTASLLLSNRDPPQDTGCLVGPLIVQAPNGKDSL